METGFEKNRQNVQCLDFVFVSFKIFFFFFPRAILEFLRDHCKISNFSGFYFVGICLNIFVLF